MGDSGKRDSTSAPSIPDWQKANDPAVGAQVAEAKENASRAPDATLGQARQFLQDPEVQITSHERKAEFLRSKGFSKDIIDALLSEDAAIGEQEVGDAPSGPGEETLAGFAKARPEIELSPDGSSVSQHEEHALIITYPEFLARRHRPSPLITMDGFFNTLYAFGGLSALLYGTNKYVFGPMADSLTDARVSLHDTAAYNLTKLIDKLEGAVSEIPAQATAPGAATMEKDGDDAESEYGDPTELFHRDIGVQTSLPASPSPANPDRSPIPQLNEAPSATQAKRIASLAAEVRTISNGFTSQSEDLAETMRVLSLFQDDLNKLRYKAPSDFFGGVGGYPPSRASEPNDEISKARDNIRRVKGVLLSARNFPTTVR
jgi:hypothetical protein